jgi:hypothetical protein
MADQSVPTSTLKQDAVSQEPRKQAWISPAIVESDIATTATNAYHGTTGSDGGTGANIYS